VIFSRGGKSGRHAAGDSRRTGAESAAPVEPAGPDELDAVDEDEEPGDRDGTGGELAGPYDVSEAPLGDRIDLGSLKIPSVQGVEVRVQANPEGVVERVVLAYAGSVLQLGVFAAPRSEGIWDEVRAEILASFKRDGVAARETAGEYGTELRAKVDTPEGKSDVRFVGIDGPRWMVRAVFQGPAAVDPAAAGPLNECLYGLVVDRGRDPMPERDPLPLRLPKELADQARAQATAQQAAADGQPPAGGVNGTVPSSGGPGGTRPTRRPR
jgi:hypothetical protein